MKNHIVMILNALVLIVIGVYGYVISGSGTALTAPGIGVVLLILSVPVKNENAAVTHIAVGLSALSVIIFFVTGFLRGNFLILIMAVITLIAVIFYIMDFLVRKKEREAGKE